MNWMKIIGRALSIGCTLVFIASIPMLIWGIAAGDNAMILGATFNMIVMAICSIAVWRNL